MVAVGMVLVIACANVASLQLARAASRQSELCLRLSLGASRSRLVRQLLTESALLGLIAGIIALLFTWALLKVSVTVVAQSIPAEYGSFVLHVTPDLAIFAYVFAISLVAGILFGLAPALESSRSALSSAVNASAASSPMRSRRLRDFLIAAQVAVSLVLLIAGSMLIRSSIHALRMDTGYDTKHVVDLDLQFPEGPKNNADSRHALVRELRNRLAGLPEVTAITSARPPDSGGIRTAAVSLNGAKPSPHNTQATLYYTFVQPNYFATLGIPLLSGRGFQSQSGQPEPSVILSQSAAQQLWPNQNPIGRSLRLGTDDQFHLKSDLVPDGPTYQVIGVARDTRGIELDGSDSQQVYVPLARKPPSGLPDPHPDQIRPVAAHGCNRSRHRIARSQPGGNNIHARPDASSNAALSHLRSCGGHRFDHRHARASSCIHGHLRHRQLYRRPPHTRSRHPHRSRRKEARHPRSHAARKHAARLCRFASRRDSLDRRVVSAARHSLRGQHR